MVKIIILFYILIQCMIFLIEDLQLPSSTWTQEVSHVRTLLLQFVTFVHICDYIICSELQSKFINFLVIYF